MGKSRSLGSRATGALCTVVLLMVMFPARSQENGIDFLVEPAEDSSTADDDGYFVVKSSPGKSFEQSLALRNDSDRTLNLRLEAVDATTGPYGGASYGLPGEKPQRVGAWISLERKRLSLGAGDSAVVGFHVRVPQDAEPGQHLAGLSVYVPAGQEDGEEAGEGQAGASLQIQARRIVAVQIELPGDDQPELVIQGVSAAARPDGVYLEVGIDNVGHGMTKGEGLVELPGEGFEQEFNIDTFVPGTSIAYPVKWTESPAEGTYEGYVEITYDGRVTSWQGTFTLGDEILDEFRDRNVTGIEVDEGLPMPLLVGVPAVLLAGILAWSILRRRRPLASPGIASSRPSPTRPSKRRSAPPRAASSPPPPPPPPGIDGPRDVVRPPPPPPPRR